MSRPNGYYGASSDRPFGQRPYPYDFPHLRPPQTQTPSLAQTFRPRHPAPLSPSEVIVLSDSEDEAPARPTDSVVRRQYIDLARDSPFSDAERRPPTAPAPRLQPRLTYSQSLGLDGPSANGAEHVLPRLDGIAQTQPPQHPTTTPTPRRLAPNDGSFTVRPKPPTAAVNEYQAPPQSGSRVVFPALARAVEPSLPTVPRPSSAGGVHNGTKPPKPTKPVNRTPPPQASTTTNPVKPTCISCTRAKLRCDGCWPCEQCRQRGDRECVYSKSPASTPPASVSPQPGPSTLPGKAARSFNLFDLVEPSPTVSVDKVAKPKPAQPAQPTEPANSAQPEQPTQPANSAQPTQPSPLAPSAPSVPSTPPTHPAQPTQTAPALETPQQRSLVIKFKLPPSKLGKKGPVADDATSEHGSDMSDDRTNSTADDGGSTPRAQSSHGQPSSRAAPRLEGSRGNIGSPSRQNNSDRAARARELLDENADENGASELLSITHLQKPIAAKAEEFESLMEEVQKRLQAWHEMSVQAELRQAKVSMRAYPQPRLEKSAKDPFQRITEQRRSAADEEARLESLGQATHPEKSHNKKLTVIRAPEQTFMSGGTQLPKYKSIGRISTSFLAPNYRTSKYRAYDATDEIHDPDITEKYAELEQRFTNNYPALKSQRHCQELVWLWKPWAAELFACLGISNSDVLYFFTQDHFDPDRELSYSWSAASAKVWREEQMRRCKTCELADPDSRRTHFSETFNSLPKPDDRTLAVAGLLAHAFHRLTRVSLWHIANGGLLQPRYEDPQAMTRRPPNFCVVCFRHHCPDHGSYEEPKDDHTAKDVEELKSYINDPEHNHNHRKFVSLPTRDRNDSPKHMCGVFCVDPSQTLPQLIGRQADGTIAGESRKMSQARQVLADDELCSASCFWDVSNRRNIKLSEVKFQPFMSQSQKLLVDKLIGFYLSNKRGPCLISRIIKDVSCLMVFDYAIFRIAQVPHSPAESGTTSDSSTAQRQHSHPRKKRKPLPLIDVSRSRILDRRPPFMPCSHDGPCHSNPACTCSRSKVHCERLCGCDESCKRRFRGCSCSARGSKICFKDSRCECWKLNRECDPALCGKCGVVEVLDSANKYIEQVRRGRCKNNRIQLGLPAPTTKAPSQVQGYGLYSRADIASGDFIGEYTGEIVSISEGNRRGAMYHVLNQEYLFGINKGQEIDASNNGNKMRFMNNSRRDENINVEPKKLLCSGVVRIGLFAKRFIKAGQELLYNYNYPESVVKNFWEPGERPTTERILIPTGSERIARTTGTNQLTDENASNNEAHDDKSLSPLPHRLKRKRPLVESPLASSRDDNGSLYLNGEESETSTSDLPPAPEIDDSQDSDYETNGLPSDEGDLGDEQDGVSELDAVGRRPMPTKGVPHRRSLRAGRRSEHSTSSRREASESHSRSRRGRRLDQEVSQSRSQSATSSNAARSNKDRAGIKRQRRIGPHDGRLGGRAQQQAWLTRRFRESQGSSMSPASASGSSR